MSYTLDFRWSGMNQMMSPRADGDVLHIEISDLHMANLYDYGEGVTLGSEFPTTYTNADHQFYIHGWCQSDWEQLESTYVEPTISSVAFSAKHANQGELGVMNFVWDNVTLPRDPEYDDSDWIFMVFWTNQGTYLDDQDAIQAEVVGFKPFGRQWTIQGRSWT